MRKARMALMLAAAGGLWFGCSNSTGPAPTIAGTWHVTVGALDSGTISPSTFDAVITTSGDSFLAKVPRLTWSVGPLVFDSVAAVGVVEDSFVVITPQSSSSTRPCDFVAVGGRSNAARDTLHGAYFSVIDTDMTGVYICKPKAQGSSVTVHK